MEQPTLESKRLLLRPFQNSDARDAQRLAGERDIADTTLNIPHPYEDGVAEEWIASHRPQFEAGNRTTFAVQLRDSGELVGAISLTIHQRMQKAELGYWIGKPFWNQGYATEAGEILVAYAFGELRLNRVSALHLVRNPASGRVMQKLGMTHEGTLRQDSMKWGRFEDLHVYGLLRDEWLSSRDVEQIS